MTLDRRDDGESLVRTQCGAFVPRARARFSSPDREALEALLKRAERLLGKPLPLDATAREALIGMADGDGRAILTLAEEVWRAARPGETLEAARLVEVVQRRAPIYDKAQDGHYNLISACTNACAAPIRTRRSIISRACSTPARIRCSSRAASCAWRPRTSALPTRRRSSSPTRPRTPTISSAVPRASWRSPRRSSMSRPRRSRTRSTRPSAPRRRSRKTQGSPTPPKTILNAPTRLMKREGYGAAYQYDHDAPDAFSGQNYWPDEARPPHALRAGRTRLRARAAQTARLLGAAAQGAGGGVGARP